MKKLILIIATIGIYNICQGQTDTIPQIEQPVATDTIPEKKKRTFEITIGKDRDSTKDDSRVKTRLLMLDYGLSSYLHKGKMNLPTELNALEQKLLGSSNWNLHLIQQRVRLQKEGKVNLVYGATLEFNKYKFSNNTTLQKDRDQVTFVDQMEDLKKNTLSATYLEVPLMINFRSKPNKNGNRFDMKLGGYAGVLLASKTRVKTEEAGKIKVRDDFNLNRVKYGLIARAGYSNFNFYVNYSLSSLFKKEEQGIYDVQPISFGISIIPF